jgi:hypothetical protein
MQQITKTPQHQRTPILRAKTQNAATNTTRQKNRQNREKNSAKNKTFCAACLFILRALKKSAKTTPPATGKNRGNPAKIHPTATNPRHHLNPRSHAGGSIL